MVIQKKTIKSTIFRRLDSGQPYLAQRHTCTYILIFWLCFSNGIFIYLIVRWTSISTFALIVFIFYFLFLFYFDMLLCFILCLLLPLLLAHLLFLVLLFLLSGSCLFSFSSFCHIPVQSLVSQSFWFYNIISSICIGSSISLDRCWIASHLSLLRIHSLIEMLPYLNIWVQTHLIA